MVDPRQQAIRLRIRKHLRKRGHEPVTLTPRMVRRWWGLLNEAVFYGMLPTPAVVELIQHKHVYAYASGGMHKRGRISLSIYPRFSSRKLFLQVLIHEMVHAWEFAYQSKMTHGPKFMEWRGRIWWALRLKLQIKL